ncbi:MAG: hypothetical protein RSB70_03265 [Clostridium sp.]
MGETILQYSLLIMLLICIGYLFIVIEVNVKKTSDYYGLNQCNFSTLRSDECSKENLDNILSIIFISTKEIMNSNNSINEDDIEIKSIHLSRIKILENQFNSTIDENSLRCMVRLSMLFLMQNHK